MGCAIEIQMGGLEIVSDDTMELKTFVGSCVAICLFDKWAKIAGMAHVMLPQKIGDKPSTRNETGRYADEALAFMISDMVKRGANRKKICAKMAGGATIFVHESEKGLFNIGARNITALRCILNARSIPIISEDVGNDFGRWVRFNVRSAEMTITSNLKKIEKVI